MMVKVKNNGSKDFEQRYKDALISIPKGKTVKMSRRDAIAFLGLLSPADPKDPNSSGLEKNLEIIPLDEIDETPDAPEKFICHVDNKEFDTQEQLDEYIKRFEDQRIKKEPEGTKNPEDDTPDLPSLTCPICKKTGIKGKHGLKVHLGQYCKG
jgi:hypothetical protein